MKARLGFVSNSSSSSFLVAVKGVWTEADFDKAAQKALRVLPDSPLVGMIHDFGKLLAESRPIDPREKPEYLEEHPDWKELEDRGFELRMGHVSNDSEEPLKVYLYTVGMPKIEVPDLRVIPAGDY